MSGSVRAWRGSSSALLDLGLCHIFTRLDTGDYEARFTVSDGLYLCKQLFLYGSGVEIVEPKELRDEMKKMLEDCLGVYGG